MSSNRKASEHAAERPAMERGSVRVCNLSKYYDAHAAVDDVSFEIERGRFVTFLGPSGSGKTTILMAIAGFVKPTSGSIVLDGADITHTSPEHRNFGMMFQGYALFPHMSVEENVWFPLRVRGISRAAARSSVMQTLELVQMAHLARRLPSELSGGQQQRVALARALVFEPSLLLLDEPLSALDKALRANLQWELRSLHRRLGATFINVTHDQEEALSMSDEVVILRDGRIEQAGSPEALYSQPRTRFVASFLGESNFFEGRSAGDETGQFSYTVDRERFVQAGSAGPGDDRPVLISLRPENIVVAPERPGTVNAVEGRIADFKYVGSSYFLQVQTTLIGQVMVKTNAGRSTVHPTTDAEIWLGWDPDASVVVQDS